MFRRPSIHLTFSTFPSSRIGRTLKNGFKRGTFDEKELSMKIDQQYFSLQIPRLICQNTLFYYYSRDFSGIHKKLLYPQAKRTPSIGAIGLYRMGVVVHRNMQGLTC